MADHKKRLILLILSDFVRRDLMENDTLAELAKVFELDIVTTYGYDSSKLSAYGKVHCARPPHWFRDAIQNNMHHLSNVRQWEPILGRMRKSYYDQRKIGMSMWARPMKWFIQCHALGLGGLIVRLANGFLNSTLSWSLDLDIKKPDLVVIPTLNRNPLANDLVRWARRKGVPSLGLQMSFDTFNIKTPSAEPDFWAVWGDHAWFNLHFARRIGSRRIDLVGSTRVDCFAHATITRNEARETLGIDADARVILFGGMAICDHRPALAMIEDAIADGALPENLLILFKPHPSLVNRNTHARGYISPAEIESDHIRFLLPRSDEVWAPLAENVVALRASDALITPFSTIGLEAAAIGIPVLTIPFFPEYTSDWYQTWYSHHRLFFDRNWCVNSADEDDFIADLNRLIGLSDDPSIAVQARESARYVSIWNENSFSERLVGSITKFCNLGKRPKAEWDVIA